MPNPSDELPKGTPIGTDDAGNPIYEDDVEAWIQKRVADVKAHIDQQSLESLRRELTDVGVTLVLELADVDHFDWPADLHLGDLLEKHLVRILKRSK